MPVKKYQCQQCGYKGSQLLQGKCPACGDANIENVLKNPPAEKEACPIRMLLLITLWCILLYKGYTILIA
ncbi:hypothetical protein [Agarilytica rhodophyticola]|uniref:hypothetical protein n=1 Tax=Agarilytica rhodophyticola TaxID=1737490 RepID=UPI000B347375